MTGHRSRQLSRKPIGTCFRRARNFFSIRKHFSERVFHLKEEKVFFTLPSSFSKTMKLAITDENLGSLDIVVLLILIWAIWFIAGS